jgi:hypothetical protein
MRSEKAPRTAPGPPSPGSVLTITPNTELTPLPPAGFSFSLWFGRPPTSMTHKRTRVAGRMVRSYVFPKRHRVADPLTPRGHGPTGALPTAS